MAKRFKKRLALFPVTTRVQSGPEGERMQIAGCKLDELAAGATASVIVTAAAPGTLPSGTLLRNEVHALRPPWGTIFT